ncbi:MAG TPA: prepilin-type N-terminal cleavage/methylation domain-containing protein [Deltaproteobacteria bacterium]|nr:prepilin-type N-terminal cleavage/methylation domain-containing protein [Deltaproteobacteria bacterium]
MKNTKVKSNKGSAPVFGDASFSVQGYSGIKGGRGFTLVEVVVVLILVGIMTALGGFGIVQAVRGYIFTRDNAAITQKAQVAMSRISREIIEMNGFTEDATSTTLPLRNVRRNVTIGLDDGALKIAQSGGTLGDGDLLVDGVDSLEVTYYEGTDELSSWDSSKSIKELSAIDIQLVLARSDGGTMEFADRVTPRNVRRTSTDLGMGGEEALPPIAPNYPSCFVATAAWGDGAHHSVVLLREFRDRFLLTWSGGRRIVAWYYARGPAAAAFIYDYPPAAAAARVMLAPLAVAAFLLLYAPAVIAFMVAAPFLYVVARVSRKLRARSDTGRRSVSGQGGSIMIGIIVTMVIMAVLVGAMVHLFSSSAMSPVYADMGWKAYFLAESGFRYAASEFVKATEDEDRADLMDDFDGMTFRLSDEGAFQLRVYPYWFESEDADAGDTGLSVKVNGTLPPEFDGGLAAGRIQVGDDIYPYASGTGSGDGISFSLSEPLEESLSSGENVRPAAQTPASSQSLSRGGDLQLKGTGAYAFPEVNGNFILPDIDENEVFNYEKRDGNTLCYITKSDAVRDDDWTDSIDVGNESDVVLSEFIKLSSTGIVGDGFSREILYNIPIGWLGDLSGGGGWEKVEHHEKFDNLDNWFTDEDQTLGGHEIEDDALNVSSMQDTGPSGSTFLGRLLSGLFGSGSSSSYAVMFFNWSETVANLAKAWLDTDGCLGYDLQVKVKNDEPYFYTGMNFRMKNNDAGDDLESYAVSFVRQRQTRYCAFLIGCLSWGYESGAADLWGWLQNDGIDAGLQPFNTNNSTTWGDDHEVYRYAWGTNRLEARYSPPAVILRQRVNSNFQILAHRTIRDGDGLTTADDGVTDLRDPSVRLKPWSTLLARVVEGYELEFTDGRVDDEGRRIRYGDTIKNADGLVSARVVAVVVENDWGGGGTYTGSGYLVLTNVEGNFTTGGPIYLEDEVYASAASAQAGNKANYIMVFFSDNSDDRNTRGDACWPSDDFIPGDDDYDDGRFTLVRWVEEDGTATLRAGRGASFLTTTGPFAHAVIKTSELPSPDWNADSEVTDFKWVDTDGNIVAGDNIALVTSSHTGEETYYDDFAIQIDMKKTTGFLPPVQQ